MPRYDLILVGAGLANGLIALRLRQQRPSLRILLIDAEREPGANHTWSFHAEDLTETQHRWIAPLVVHHWPGYEVRFPQRSRSLNSGYFCVTAERFAQVIRDRFAPDLLLNTRVASIASRAVTLDDGRVLESDAVIDGRGYQPDAALRMGFQSFVGQEWQLSEPHGLTAPIIMDATVPHVVVHGKGGKWRAIPMTAYSIELVKRYMETPKWQAAKLAGNTRLMADPHTAVRRWTADGLSRVLMKAVEHLMGEVPGLRIPKPQMPLHWLRFLFCTHIYEGMVSAGREDILLLARYMGHTSITMTQAYILQHPNRLGSGGALHPLANMTPPPQGDV